MALGRCGECGKEVSTKAESCPHCGAPIAGARSAGSTEGPFLQTLNVGCVGCLVIIGLVFVVSLFGGMAALP